MVMEMIWTDRWLEAFKCILNGTSPISVLDKHMTMNPLLGKHGFPPEFTLMQMGAGMTIKVYRFYIGTLFDEYLPKSSWK